MTRPIDLIAENINATFNNSVGKCVSLLITLDETTTNISDTAQLSIFIRTMGHIQKFFNFFMDNRVQNKATFEFFLRLHSFYRGLRARRSNQEISRK